MSARVVVHPCCRTVGCRSICEGDSTHTHVTLCSLCLEVTALVRDDPTSARIIRVHVRSAYASSVMSVHDTASEDTRAGALSGALGGMDGMVGTRCYG
jgi:hypothetical protein